MHTNDRLPQVFYCASVAVALAHNTRADTVKPVIGRTSYNDVHKVIAARSQSWRKGGEQRTFNGRAGR